MRDGYASQNTWLVCDHAHWYFLLQYLPMGCYHDVHYGVSVFDALSVFLIERSLSLHP